MNKYNFNTVQDIQLHIGNINIDDFILTDIYNRSFIYKLSIEFGCEDFIMKNFEIISKDLQSYPFFHLIDQIKSNNLLKNTLQQLIESNNSSGFHSKDDSNISSNDYSFVYFDELNNDLL